MNCNICDKFLIEEDTHESILCTSCMNAQEKTHCARCRCVLTLHKMFVRGVTFIRKQHKFLLVLFVVSLLVAAIMPFWPMVALKIALGAIGLLTLAVGLIATIWLLFPFTYRFGDWICDKLNIHLQDIDHGPEGIVIWLIGLVPYGMPFVLYYAGALVFNIFLKK